MFLHCPICLEEFKNWWLWDKSLFFFGGRWVFVYSERAVFFTCLNNKMYRKIFIYDPIVEGTENWVMLSFSWLRLPYSNICQRTQYSTWLTTQSGANKQHFLWKAYLVDNANALWTNSILKPNDIRRCQKSVLTILLWDSSCTTFASDTWCCCSTRDLMLLFKPLDGILVKYNATSDITLSFEWMVYLSNTRQPHAIKEYGRYVNWSDGDIVCIYWWLCRQGHETFLWYLRALQHK